MSLRRSHVVVVLVMSALADCVARPSEEVRTSACPSRWREAWTADSVAALCLPAGFLPRGPRRFARPRGDTLPEHWIAISVDSTAHWSTGDAWPLRLGSGPGCLADCTTVEDSRVYADSVAGVLGHLETGLVSGGIAGEIRQPALVASAEVRPGLRVVVNALSPDRALLDSLRLATRSIRVGGSDRVPRAGHVTSR
jgi:hypothetical protein